MKKRQQPKAVKVPYNDQEKEEITRLSGAIDKAKIKFADAVATLEMNKAQAKEKVNIAYREKVEYIKMLDNKYKGGKNGK